MDHKADRSFTVVEICAGAGGQSLGLHKAGFKHELAVEIDPTAASTLETNLETRVAVGDVADASVWDPAEYAGVDLLAGGVPCPPFSIAGKQLGSSDERDLFAWSIEQVEAVRPRAVMLENVRGLAAPRFSAYRQRVLDRLREAGYIGEWRLLHAADFGVPQLRPRFVLVAMKPEDHQYFRFPEPTVAVHRTVGEALYDLMAARGWTAVDEWRELAADIGPTLVGGSKKHGGADLGPSRAKASWSKLAVDGRGVADEAPARDAPSALVTPPRLTIAMAARIQGWLPEDNWFFQGRKTSQYRQIGNAFPPPVAEAIGRQIASAFRHEGVARADLAQGLDIHDPVYSALASSDSPLTIRQLVAAFQEGSESSVQQRLASLRQDFEIEVATSSDGESSYKLGAFKGFIGQADHRRHDFVTRQRNRVS